MKILMFFYDLTGAAGIQRVITTLSGAMRDQGAEVRVLVTSPETRSFFELDPRVPVDSLSLPEPTTENRLGRWAAKSRWALAVTSRLRRYVRDHDITHVIDHGTALGLLYPRRKLGPAHFVLFRHFPVSAFPNGAFVYRAIRTLKRDAHVVVLTPSIRAELLRLGYRDVEVIGNPVRYATAATPCARSDELVLAVGRDSPQKGFDVLLHGFALLAAERPRLRLRLIGPGIPESPTLLSLVARCGLDGRVSLEPPVTDLGPIIDSAAVVVLPSRYEALPMFLLEALGRGAPVVGTNVDGIRDFLRDGDNGVLVPPESPAAMAGAIASLLDDLSLARRITSNAPASIAHLGPDRIATQWLEYLGALA